MRRHFCLLWFTIVVIVLPVAVQAQTEVVEYYVTDAIGSIRLVGMSLRLLKFSGGSVDDYAICRSS